MNCLRCDSHEFTRQENAVIEQEFKGEQLTVKAPAMVCTKCGWVTVGLDQLDELRRRTADAYREKHGLLTSEQIRNYRKSLKMNQLDFAAFLRVGDASVKRWETWQVQESSSDELIRAKCEMELLKRHSLQATMSVWISGFYVKATHHASHAASVVGAQANPAAHCGWPESENQVKREHTSASAASTCVANEELALAA